jgi:hypothetical protein
MFEHGALWGVATILGPLLLLAAMVYGVVMYRRRGPTSKQLTEESTRTLYREGSKSERRQEAVDEAVNSPPLAPGSSPGASTRPQDWAESTKSAGTEIAARAQGPR